MVGGPDAVTPVPARATVARELAALLTTEMLPVTEAAAVGTKLALKVAVWPAAKVRGRVSPLTLKPVPVTLA